MPLRRNSARPRPWPPFPAPRVAWRRSCSYCSTKCWSATPSPGDSFSGVFFDAAASGVRPFVDEPSSRSVLLLLPVGVLRFLYRPVLLKSFALGFRSPRSFRWARTMASSFMKHLRRRFAAGRYQLVYTEPALGCQKWKSQFMSERLHQSCARHQPHPSILTRVSQNPGASR